jgi:hypothetical protein
MQKRIYKYLAIFLGLVSLYLLLGLALIYGGGHLFSGQTINSQIPFGSLLLFFILPVWTIGNSADGAVVAMMVTSVIFLLFAIFLYRKLR